MKKSTAPSYEIDWIDDPDFIEACIYLDSIIAAGQITTGSESYRIDLDDPTHTRRRVIPVKRNVT